MVWLFVSVFIVFVLLCISEGLWRAKLLRGERGRKLVHITVGSFVAFWPFFMSFRHIQVLSAAFLIAVLLSKKFHIFHAIHAVRRRTWGEIIFAVCIGVVSSVTTSKWIFTAAVLHMSLADGLAAIIGITYGKKNRYYVFGQQKSVAGSATFLVISVAIVLVFIAQSPDGFQSMTFPFVAVCLPFMATILENLSILGTDNITVPLLVALTLTYV